MLSVVAGIKAAAGRNSAGPALVSGSRIITYRELLDLIARISNLIAARGLPPLSKLFINTADPDIRLATMIAAMHAGMIPFALADLGELKADVDYDLVVGTADLSASEPKPDLLLDQLNLTGPLADARLREFPDRGDNDILFVCSTTGTTGRPKLVAELAGRYETRSARRTEIGRATGERAVTSRDRVMLTTGHLTKGAIGGALKALAVGATHVRFLADLPDCLRLINVIGVNRLTTVPSTIGDMMDVMEADSIGCPTLSDIVLTGGLLRRDLLERIERNFEAEIWIHYGSSETGIVARGRATAASFSEGYVGALEPGIALISAGSREEPSGLVVAMPQRPIAPYYARGKLTFETSTMHALPDLGYVSGLNLHISGRNDEVLNFSGNKTAYGVIEADLIALPGIADAAVVGAAAIGDSDGVVVGVATAGSWDEAAMLAQISRTARLPPQAARHIRIFRVERIPRNAGGKVDRAALLRAFRQATTAGQPTGVTPQER
ncbi:MAG: class I adenylate-forming enzyme family protein [Bauldia sp.]